MKKLSLALLALIVMASCKKNEDFDKVDDISNQGNTTALVGYKILKPGQRIIVPHSEFYRIVCEEECKVNINGALFYKTGDYRMELFFKKK